jgi:hypothetical protein
LNGYQWAKATWGVQVLDVEFPVVVDLIGAAGTPDRLVKITTEDPKQFFIRDQKPVMIADIKTGQWEPQYPMGVEMQCAIYAHGERYDARTGKRSPIHPDLDLRRGVLIHVPVGQRKTTLYPLDLDRGWRNVLLALEVKAARAASKALEPWETT